MTGAIIAELLIKFGPIALNWIYELSQNWNTKMTPEQVKAFCEAKRKDYDEYIEAERAKRVA